MQNDGFKQQLMNKLHNNEDVKAHSFDFLSHKIDIIFLECLTNYNQLNANLIKPILEYATNNADTTIESSEDIKKILKKEIISIGGVIEINSKDDISLSVCRGDVVLIIDDNSNFVLNFALSNAPKRAITEPPTSAVINGPREGFIEDIKTNVTLIRKRLATEDLVFKDLEIGRYTKTRVAILYLNSIADTKIVKQIEQKLKNINIDGIIDSNYLVDFLSCRPNSLFKQVGKSEKPDIIVAKMLEGRIAILVDGSPVVLTIPFIIIEDLQNSADYYERNYKVILVRYLRFFGVLLAVLLPGVYVAVQLYHFKIVPIKFLVSIVNTTQGIPVTPFLEILFVIALFEILYEASLRMPRYLGMALSVVGALILGDTAVRAGIISSPAVLIVALSGITIYTVPEQAGQLSILRLFFVISGATLSFFGIICSGIFILVYLNDFDHYGVPYLSPLSPKIPEDYKDALNRVTFNNMKNRPKALNQKNKRRLS